MRAQLADGVAPPPASAICKSMPGRCAGVRATDEIVANTPHTATLNYEDGDNVRAPLAPWDAHGVSRPLTRPPRADHHLPVQQPAGGQRAVHVGRAAVRPCDTERVPGPAADGLVGACSGASEIVMLRAVQGFGMFCAVLSRSPVAPSCR